MKERKRRSVLQSARADGDGMRRPPGHLLFYYSWISEGCFITAEKGGVARAKGEGEKEKECTTKCKSRRRRDAKAPWALGHQEGQTEQHAMSVSAVNLFVLLQLKREK